MRVLLIGNYGAGNLGDELVHEALMEELRGFHVSVLSASPKEGELPRLPAGIRSLLMTSWWKAILAMRKADAVVFGGGTLLSDSESQKAPILWGLHAAVAGKLKKPVFLCYQGIGPLRSRLSQAISRRTLQHASFLSLRDARVPTNCPSGLNTQIIQTFDPVFRLLTREKSEGKVCIKNVFTIVPRFSVSWKGDRITTLRADLERLRGQGVFKRVEILSFAPRQKQEWHLCEKLARGVGDVIPVSTKRELLDHLCPSAFVLSGRYHGLIAALALGIPCAAIGAQPGDKLMTLAEECGFPALVFSQWNGTLQTFLHNQTLSEEKREELLERCERGRIALKRALVAVMVSLLARPKLVSEGGST